MGKVTHVKDVFDLLFVIFIGVEQKGSVFSDGKKMEKRVEMRG